MAENGAPRIRSTHGVRSAALFFFADICAQFPHTPYAVTFAAIGAREDAGFRHVWYRTRIITGQYSSAAFAPVTKA